MEELRSNNKDAVDQNKSIQFMPGFKENMIKLIPYIESGDRQ
jgi:hypothetical protein